MQWNGRHKRSLTGKQIELQEGKLLHNSLLSMWQEIDVIAFPIQKILFSLMLVLWLTRVALAPLSFASLGRFEADQYGSR